MALIYLIQNLINGKCYVGQTQFSMAHRWNKRIYLIRSGRGNYFHRAVRKYGYENFVKQELSFSNDKKSLDNLETLWIILLRSFDPSFGYNLTMGGEGLQNPSKIIRAKIGEANRGEKNGMFGKHLSENAKRLVGIASRGNEYRLGTKQSDETKRAIGAANKGNEHNMGCIRSLETRSKMRASWSPSDLRRLKHAEAMRNPEYRKKMSEIVRRSWEKRKGLCL
jgi:NUMOD3 motif/GIY-YIG catalytic domain